MDLRQQRTRRSLVNAFLALRTKKPIEKITVRELAEQAQIHKATFYLHYHDIYELSEQLEYEVIDDIFSGLSDPTELLTNMQRFNEELYTLLVSHESLLGILFSGSRAGILAEMLEKRLKTYIFELHPEYREDLEYNVVLTYLIHGAYRAYMQYRDREPKEILLIINTVASSVLRQYTGEAPQAKELPEEAPAE
ncbi:MAG: TetR/AcrR family transcriptional regulator [Oscillospiraceae bacterium]|nr:TetR/AcrR family transcriptional regulator [Oscillospiraceae bacterium]